MEIIRSKSFAFIVVLMFLALLSVLLSPPKPKPVLESHDNNYYVELPGVKIEVTLARTPAEHAQGLSGRPSLGEYEGMFFIFETPGKYGFWMKDMNFAIDMIWLDEAGKIIYIKKDARPESYPSTFGPDQNAKYVLETVSGLADSVDLKVGDQAEFTF
jgi:uncharacterized protein